MSKKKTKRKNNKNYNFKNEKKYREKYKNLFENNSNKSGNRLDDFDDVKSEEPRHAKKKSLKKEDVDVLVNDKKDKKEISEDVEKVIIKKKKEKILKVLFVFLLIIIVSVLGYFGYRTYMRNEISKKINESINIEYGEEVTDKYILKDKFKKVKFSPKLSSLKKVGKHEIILNIDGYEFKVIVNIRDTTSPELEVKDVQKYLDEELPKAEDFVSKVDDLSEVSLNMGEVLKQAGEQEVEIIATDKYGNKTSKKAKFIVKEYKGSVKINGLTNLTVYVNSKPNLTNGVSATDDRFGKLEFTVDDSKVNYSKPGSYKVYYTVKDKLGNITTMERKIVVKERTVMINNFPTYSQFPNYPNGCETIALYVMLKYYGVSVSPETLVNNLKKGDGVHWENNIRYGGDPEIEFVGDPRDQHGYGVYQKPIINLASKYKSGMIDYTGHSLSQVLEIVRSGKPVQVWVSINLKNTSVCADWIHKASGKKINWICSLHSVVIVGFNDTYVYVSDPYTGGIEKYKKTQFQKMYNLFGKRALYFK